MDAVQAAGSGHPGTPMAMAPAAYCPWHRVLRFDPDDPIWPNPRPVRAVDRPRVHAALRPASPHGGAGRRRGVRAYRAPVDHTGRHQMLPAAREPLPGPSGVPLDVGRGDDGRGRSARGSRRASAWPSPPRWLAARFNRPGFDLFDYDVYALCGDGCLIGRRRERGGVARGPPPVGESLLDLRQQPHHDRGRDLAGVHRRRRGHASWRTAGT